VRFIAAWLPQSIRPAVQEWGAVVEARCLNLQPDFLAHVLDSSMHGVATALRQGNSCRVACRVLCRSVHAQPGKKRQNGVQVSAEGQVLQALYDPDGAHISYVSAVTEVGERLYFGNLAKDYVSYVQKPAAA
jgi:hypothetical protein